MGYVTEVYGLEKMNKRILWNNFAVLSTKNALHFTYAILVENISRHSIV